ncbi:MAG: lincosamide and streptogramin transport system ATP-binding/permease protein [Clostridiales bacterium]|nr:lincosamide and streptogramin transport system ATP-binding/permease protein [Clostridiales bacterium]
MSQINVTNLTFSYEGSFDTIFDKVSLVIDTDWKLGLIGRNGKGKTTFLNLLLGKYDYLGTITAPKRFAYFPYPLTKEEREKSAADIVEDALVYESWRVICELDKLKMEAKKLYQPFCTLSQGEQTKVMLAMLFSREEDFYLLDEPTNHLDLASREILKSYLKTKKGFILISHDRDLLDACIDHVLALNRTSIEITKGNFSTWWENKEKKDTFMQAENEKHLHEISKLKKAAKQASDWAKKGESRKIGFDPIKENDRSIATRSYIGAKTKKMQSKRKQIEHRIGQEIQQKEGLLQDIEATKMLKMMPLTHHKEVFIRAKKYGFTYLGETMNHEVLKDFNIELRQGERLLLKGQNGCGKSTFLKSVLSHCDKSDDVLTKKVESGELTIASGLLVSYVSQDTSFLKGTIYEWLEMEEGEPTLIMTLLHQLGFERKQFEKRMEEFSEGQKKKVLLAKSLMTRAHLYIWDEPFNYVDLFARMQIEQLLLTYQPTMLLVEHDPVFGDSVATKIISMNNDK